MLIHSLPIARPDETLYSVAARIRLANAAKNDIDACRSLFGSSSNMRVSDFPVDLTRFCDVTQDSFGDTSSVLNNMTLAGFFERLGSRPWNAGSTPASIINAGYGLATLSNGSAGRWRVCKHCISSDLACFATAFWRRAHHLPTTLVCPVHEIPLTACVLGPLERQKRFLLPEQTEADSSMMPIDWTANYYRDLIRLTMLGIDVLEDARQAVCAKTVSATLLSALGARGLLTVTRMIRRLPFSSEFTHRYQFLTCCPDFTAALSPQGIDILQRSFAHTAPPRSAIHNLLLIDWLFGSWEAFHQHCLWQETMDSAPLRPVRHEPEALQQMHRKICVAYLKTNATATRSRFARAAPASFRWLRRYDEEWFDTNMPITRSTNTQQILF